MPYNIDRYSGTSPVVVEDGTINSTFDIKLVGKNYAGYGEVQNENFLHMLEHFSSTSAPPRPISGQIWFDSFTNKLKFFDKNNNWRTTGGAEIGGTEPIGLTTGDFWFDSANNQLYAKAAGGDFVLIGPQSAADQRKLAVLRGVEVALHGPDADQHPAGLLVLDQHPKDRRPQAPQAVLDDQRGRQSRQLVLL